MKIKNILAVIVIICGAVFLAFSQQEFTLTVNPANAGGSWANIDMPGLTGNPLAIIIATPLGDTELLNPHPIGAWYYAGKWKLNNTNGERMPVGAKYRIQFFLKPGPNQFLHLITKENLGSEGSYIDNPGLNNNPDAKVQILHNHAAEVRSPYNVNRFAAKAGYSSAAGRWYIANINEEPIGRGSAYNVVIISGGTVGANTSPTGINPTGPQPLAPVPSPSPHFGGVLIETYPTPARLPMPTPTPTPAPASLVPIGKQPPRENPRWILHEDLKPTIAPNAEILLFIHGMDSRAEEATDITKELFALMANRTSSPQPPPTPPPAAGPPAPDPLVVAVLQQLLQKYKGCILEKYETKADMTVRGLHPDLSGLVHTGGLQDRDIVACVAGKFCSRASRVASFNSLQAQANLGDPTDFQTNLEKAIPKDCFDCNKHQEQHTKHVHCTMEAGGNSGFQGPYFEGCKAGVDMEALANSIARDISGAISGITGAVPQTQVTGGPSIATNYSTVNFTSPEPCDNPDNLSGGQPTAVLPTDYYTPLIPAAMLDTPKPANFNNPAARNIGSNEGRLRPDLRQAAAAGKPLESLRSAAYQFAAGNTDMGKAFADLSVTGHRAFADFRIALPKEPFCQSVISSRPAQLSESAVMTGCRTALDRAYRVANFLRTGQRGDTPAEKTRKTNERIALGWIAVSGEDDSPHRPVNVPSSDYPQYDIDVVVEAPSASGAKTVTVRTRYWIAQSQTANPGSGSKNLVMISLDLPTSGYSQNLDFERVSPLADIGNPKWTPLPVPIFVPWELTFLITGLIPGMPPVIPPPGLTIPPLTPLPDFHATGKTPLLDFIETFIVRFGETLDQKVPVKNKFRAVMGGSLGGNMTFRLGRRSDVPWLPKFIVWSPASIWNSMGEGADILKHIGPRSGWEKANNARNSPNPGHRAQFFGGWDEAIIPLIIPMAQSDTWTSNHYKCKKSSIAAARLDRHETYDPRFLAWRWRLGTEQLLYSHQTTDPNTNRPRFMSNLKPMLLACGTEDNVKFNDICAATQRTAPLMTMTPGKALFLYKTGHSLDNERRMYFAKEIVEFLGL